MNDTIRARFKNGITVGGQTVEVTGKTRKEMRGSKDTQYLIMNDTTRYGVKVRSVANLDEVIKASRGYVGEERSHDRTDDIVEFARGNVLLRFGGKPYQAEVLVATTTDNSMLLYDIENMYEAEVIVGTRKDDSLRLYDIINLRPTQITKKGATEPRLNR